MPFCFKMKCFFLMPNVCCMLAGSLSALLMGFSALPFSVFEFTNSHWFPPADWQWRSTGADLEHNSIQAAPSLWLAFLPCPWSPRRRKAFQKNHLPFQSIVWWACWVASHKKWYYPISTCGRALSKSRNSAVMLGGHSRCFPDAESTPVALQSSLLRARPCKALS